VHPEIGEKMSGRTNGKNKSEKIPKGYRLKVSTHNKIKELQGLTNGSQEKVISRAIRLYSQKVQSKLNR
jgi:hypothetical protein